MPGEVFQGLKPQGSPSLRSFKPDIRFRATFYNTNGVRLYAGIETSGGLTSQQGSDVTQASTFKNLGSPMGTYSLTLVPRAHDYLQRIAPGDWCAIDGDNGAGLGMQTIMYGPVTSVHKRVAVAQHGKTQTVINVTGNDFGKAFALTTAFQDQTLARDPAFSNLGLAKVTTRLKGFLGTPGEIVEKLMEVFLDSGLEQWFDPVTGKPFGLDWFQTDYIDKNLKGKAVIVPFTLSANLWQILQQWQNPAINEMFIDFRPPFDNQSDLINLSPALVLRQYPYWGSAWDNLTSAIVAKDEIVSADLGTSDEEVKNWFRVMDEPTATGPAVGTAVYLPIGIFNNESIKRFGFRRFEMPTQYLYDPTAVPQVCQYDLLKEFTALHALWYHSNEYLLNGSITTYFRPDIRVGYRLDVDEVGDDYYQYYVEGVQHSLAYPGQSSTTLTVTRGRKSKNELFLWDLDRLTKEGVIEGVGDTVSRIQAALTSGLRS